MHATLPLLRSREFPAIARKRLETLQVNVGYKCNQTCVHCHVNAGPNRTEVMPREVAETALAFLRNSDVKTLDLTGGAPELNPHFRYLVTGARQLGVKVMDRCNLTILSEPGQEDLAGFLAAHQVEVVASLPCYLEDNVDRQRGKGVFSGSIAGLRKLNALGYGRAGTGLVLNLVYNPQGTSLPPAQAPLEEAYRSHLRAEYGVEFDRLFTMANMPIARFGSTLISKGQFNAYMTLLQASYREENLEQVMCRTLLSVDWQGYVYDCDFNQMLELPARFDRKRRTRLADLVGKDLSGRPIVVADHCFGCTAGQGSSCGGRSRSDMSRDAPGRNCPLSYRYSPEVFRRAPEIAAETLYVIGGLYGNPFALDAIVELAAQESPAPTLVFNGDFNWFDVDAGTFAALNARVLEHVALRGNVETELASDEAAAGCGCAYPEYVGDADVARSNAILGRLRETARGFPRLRERLGRLPMHAVAAVAGVRIAIVHGDAWSLAGWRFAQEALAEEAIERAFDAADVSVFASSHTCLPVTSRLPSGVIANNGAAGMPNFRGTRYGLVTRIAAAGRADALYRERLGPLAVETLAVRYDHERWLAQFDRLWPAGSPAAVSYRKRITEGPGYDLAQALRRAVRSPAAPRQNAATG